MRTPGKIVSIPTPCHEDLNKMIPGGNGRFCGSCQKTVVDFRNRSDQEIIDFMEARKGESVCGHFSVNQLDRPLIVTVSLKELPSYLHPVRIFAVALFIAFGTTLISCHDHHDKKIREVRVENSDDEYPTTIGEIEVPDDTVQTVSGREMPPPPPPPPMISTRLYTGVVDMRTTPVSEESFTRGKAVIADTAKSTTVECQSNDDLEMPDIVFGTLGSVGMLAYTVNDEERVADVEDVLPAERIEEGVNAIEDDQSAPFETRFDIYPNPAVSECTISYKLNSRCDVLIEILDENGSLVRTLSNIKKQHTGNYYVPVFLSSLHPGLYVVRLITGSSMFSRKLIVSR